MDILIIALAAILILVGLLVIKRGKEKTVTYVIGLILIIGGVWGGYFGFNRINTTPHTYEVTKNSEISKGNYQIQLTRTDNGTSIFLPSVDKEISEQFPIGIEVELTNKEINDFVN